jgi:GH15 family glucan-1,4-alpha-glucosidase
MSSPRKNPRTSPQIKKILNWIQIGVISTLIWNTGRYLVGLFLKPKHFPRFISLDHRVDIETVEKGYHIARENLKQSIELRLLPNGEIKHVLCAGHRNFREPWARDLSFALFGLMEIGEAETAKESLEVFLHFQKSSGQFPIKCYSTGIVDRYMHSLFGRNQPIQLPLRPKYFSGHRTVSLDGNALLVIACFNYATYSGDLDFVRTHWQALKQAVYWLERQALGGSSLLNQAAYSDWADSLARTGHVLYTNVVYWKVLSEMADFSIKIGSKDDISEWKEKAAQTKSAIRSELWRQDLGYFVTSQEFDNLSSAGNLLAIAWGLTTKKQAESILKAISRFEMDQPVPTRVMQGTVPLKYIALENRFAGIPEYHTQAAWLWLGAWHVISLAEAGMHAEAEEILERILHIVVRDKIVYEVYGVDGKYLRTRWYTAEAPLTWSAGMIVYAYHFLDKRKEKQLGTFESEEV